MDFLLTANFLTWALFFVPDLFDFFVVVLTLSSILEPLNKIATAIRLMYYFNMLKKPFPIKMVFKFEKNYQSNLCNSRPPPPPPAEKDLFLTCSSQLKEFSTLNGPGSWASLDYFVICAQKYMLSGASVDVLCEHNALVSDAAKRSQVAEAWVRT